MSIAPLGPAHDPDEESKHPDGQSTQELMVPDEDVEIGVKQARSVARNVMGELKVQPDTLGFLNDQHLEKAMGSLFGGGATMLLNEGVALQKVREHLKKQIEFELQKIKRTAESVRIAMGALLHKGMTVEARKSGINLNGIVPRHPLALKVMQRVQEALIGRFLGKMPPAPDAAPDIDMVFGTVKHALLAILEEQKSA